MTIGTVLNAIVLFYYFEDRRARQRGQVSAEIATVANSIATPAKDLAQSGDLRRARSLLAVFSGFPFAICADLKPKPEADPIVSWPVIGCERIRKQGRDIEVPVATAGPEMVMLVRMDEVILANELRTEVGVVVLLGLFGGAALMLAGGFAFLWLINRPMSQMLRAIERFERHDDPQRVAYRSEDEIGRVITSYNAMLDREVERVSEVRKAHRDIVDSVTYATRIQQALLPAPELCALAFEEHAVIWKPRDLVGGDIYWVRSDGAHTTLAVIDCTGHGVPGGFMTMLAIATLERIFAENDALTPGAALSRLSDLTRKLLNQDRASGTSNDGLDAAICRINAASGEVLFAGARLSMLISDGEEVRRIRGDRISLGYPETPVSPQLTEHSVKVGKEAVALLATDGLIDQPGGPKRLSFGYRRALSALLANGGAGPEVLLAALTTAFEEYVDNETLRDDLTVFAFKRRHSPTKLNS